MEVATSVAGQSIELAARMRVAIVQMKPRKGRYAENLASRRRGVRAARATTPPDLDRLSRSRADRIFSRRRGLRSGAATRGAFARDLAGRLARRRRRAAVDVVAGFYENDDGTYYNSALYLQVDGDGEAQIVHVHRKMFLPTYGVFDEERFLSRGRKLGVFETRFGTRGDADLRGRLARDRADDRGGQGRAHPDRSERLARARHRRRRRARQRRRAGARCCARRRSSTACSWSMPG